MKILKIIVVAVAACAVQLCGAQPVSCQFIPANDPGITYMGRISRRYSPNVAFTYPGVSILADFKGTSLAMAVKPGSGDFMVEIDGGLPFRIHFGEADSLCVLAEGLPDGTHSARIMYAIEGHELRPVFKGLYVDEGKELAPGPCFRGGASSS